MANKLEPFIEYAQKFIGLPYFYGGDDPMSGFDCSGLASECLRAYGFIGCKERLNAQMIFDRWKATKHQVTAPKRGCLVFFGKLPDKIIHVALCLSETVMLEAGGGGNLTDTKEEQIAQNAFVRQRPIGMRSDFIGCVNLFIDERT